MSGVGEDMQTELTLEMEYDRLYDELMEAHQPRNAHERVLVEEFVDACWDLKAARRVDREFWSYVGGHYGRAECGVAEAQFHEREVRFRIHLRFRTNAERSYYRALAAVKSSKRERPRALAVCHCAAESTEANATDHWPPATDH